jgi:hypothetical protein
MSYELQGLCTEHDEPDLWFADVAEPTRDTGKFTIKEKQAIVNNAIVALSICGKCDVKTECLAEGMKPENLEHGIWGGTMSGERILLAGIATNREDRKQRIAFAHRVRVNQ